MRVKLTDDFLGKYAILNRGYAKGLIGLIELNTTGRGITKYIHSTKSGINTGIVYEDEIELVDIS